MNDSISFQYAIFYLPEPTKDPLNELGSLLDEKFSEIQRVETVDPKASRLEMATKLESDPKRTYPPPDLDGLRHSGRGLSKHQAEALQETGKVLVLTFAHSKDQVWDGLKTATKLVHALAQSTDGLIWDDETKEVFSPEEWESRRITEWDDKIPDISTQITIHVYQKDELVRAITLGMSKFGLPDIVIEQFPWSIKRNVGHVINLLVQALAEGAVVTKAGEFDLDFKAIKHSGVREPQITTLKSKATGVALLSLREGTWEEGDPQNRLIEVTFERGSGPDATAQLEDILSRAFGSEDAISRIQHDDELKEASRQARAKLPLLREAFQIGLAPGEFILVKAPFKTPSENQEWMWVEVTSWQDGKITGLLQNDPFDIPDLKAGQSVNVSEADVFDYIRTYADGRTEGNETAKVIEKQSK